MEEPTLSVTRVTGWTGGTRTQVTFARFIHELGQTSRAGHQAHTWAGQAPDGTPLVVIWVIGRRSGAALRVYELVGGEDL